MVIIPTVHSIFTQDKLLYSETFTFTNIKTLSKPKLSVSIETRCDTKTYKIVFKYY